MAMLKLVVAMSSSPHVPKYTFPSFTPPMLPHARTCRRPRGLNSHFIRGLKGDYLDESCEVLRESCTSTLCRTFFKRGFRPITDRKVVHVSQGWVVVFHSSGPAASTCNILRVQHAFLTTRTGCSQGDSVRQFTLKGSFRRKPMV